MVVTNFHNATPKKELECKEKETKSAQPPPNPESESETDSSKEDVPQSSSPVKSSAVVLAERRKIINDRNFHKEKPVGLKEGEYEEEFRAELVSRNWEELASLPE